MGYLGTDDGGTLTEIISALGTVAERYDAVFCDLWGCLHNGKAPFPAAVAALQGFRARRGKVVLLTNAPRPFGTVAAQLDAMGVPRDAWDLVVTSGDAAQTAMLAGAVGRKVFFIGAGKDEAFFRDLPSDAGGAVERVALDQAEGVVCTGLRDDLTETPDDYRLELMQAKARDLPFLCANPDVIVDFGDKRLYCAGALAQSYEAMGGRAIYVGKPHPPIYDLARRRLAVLAAVDLRILCIGDGVTTDIRGGVAEDLDTLFVTGGIAAAEFGTDAENPDQGLLDGWLAGQQLAATYAIGKLR